MFLKITSSNVAFQPISYKIGISFGSIMNPIVNFGTGKYSVLRKRGDAATLSIDSNDRFTLTSVQPGISSFLIADQRGITTSMVVVVGDGWVLTSNELTVTVEGNRYYTFPLQYGEGGWRIISPISEEPWLVVMPKGKEHWQDMLQIYADKDSKEPVVYTLQDKVKNKATITVRVKQ